MYLRSLQAMTCPTRSVSVMRWASKILGEQIWLALGLPFLDQELRTSELLLWWHLHWLHVCEHSYLSEGFLHLQQLVGESIIQWKAPDLVEPIAVSVRVSKFRPDLRMTSTCVMWYRSNSPTLLTGLICFWRAWVDFCPSCWSWLFSILPASLWRWSHCNFHKLHFNCYCLGACVREGNSDSWVNAYDGAEAMDPVGLVVPQTVPFWPHLSHYHVHSPQGTVSSTPTPQTPSHPHTLGQDISK